MPSEISQKYISDLLDELNFESGIDYDCDLFIILDADSDFEYNVQIYYTVEDNHWLRVWAIAPDFDSQCANKQKVLDAINKCNAAQKFVKAYLMNDNRIIIERYELIDEYVSDDYIKINCLKAVSSALWQAFVRIGNEL